MNRHRFHGDPERFRVVADYVADEFGRSINYVADVAGGQGMLSRILSKRHNYVCEVIDPRGWVLRGVRSQQHEYQAEEASFYDLVIGLHPDQAIRAVAQSALVTPTILIPCCNFWSAAKLGREELLLAVTHYYTEHDVPFKRVVFEFNGPKNIGLVTRPPQAGTLSQIGELLSDLE